MEAHTVSSSDDFIRNDMRPMDEKNVFEFIYRKEMRELIGCATKRPVVSAVPEKVIEMSAVPALSAYY